MNIDNFSKACGHCSAPKIPHYENLLDAELMLLDQESDKPYGITKKLLGFLPLDAKQKLLARVEHESPGFREKVAIRRQKEWLQKATFPLFLRLPAELRDSILSLALAQHTEPRIHFIKRCSKANNNSCHPWTFRSKQPIHPLLHVSHESRNFYFNNMEKKKINMVFAFETYINFDADIVYIGDLGPRTMMDTFEKFVVCDDAKMIQRLALKWDIFASLPPLMWNLAASGTVTSFYQHYMALRTRLPAWREVLIVCDKGVSKSCHDMHAKFRNLDSVELSRMPGRLMTQRVVRKFNRVEEMHTVGTSPPIVHRWVVSN